MKNLHTKIIVTLSALTLVMAGSFITNVSSAANYFSMGGNTYECTDPTADGYDVDQGLCYSWCFVEETKVTMADGSEKNIEDVMVGDWLKGSNGPNRVEFLVRKYNDGKVYSFNGGRYFVTDSHPFKTTDGWKSINPDATRLGHPGVDVEKLEVGDVLITENGNVELKSIDGKDDPQEVYTFGVNGTHDYYADGYLVHNKYPPNIPCPAGWFSLEDDIYDWSFSTSPQIGYNCFGRDLGPAVLIGASGTGGLAIDRDIINLIYWDKNINGTYDNGTDRALLIPTYAVSASGDNGWLYYTNYYMSGFGRYNNGLNLAKVGQYSFGISQSSTPWLNLVNQGLTPNNAIAGSVYADTGFWYITGLNVGLDFTCNGSGSEVLSFSEYSCPAGYLNFGMNCRTGSTVSGGPCVYNTDCNGGGTCVGGGYTPPVSAFRYNDASPWNASHPYWNDKPHAPSPGDFCRNGDEGGDSNPDPGTPVPCWYYPGPNGNYCGQAIGGGGCGNFVPMVGTTTYGTCSTSSSNTITATEVIVTETVACTGTGGSSCTPGSGNIADYAVSPNATASTISYAGTGITGTKTVRYHLQYTCGAIPTTHWEGTMTIASGATSGTGDNSAIATACLGNMPVNREDEYIVDTNVSCSAGGGGSCVPSRTCSVGYTLTGDTNSDGNPNCAKVTCTTTTGGTTLYDYSYDWTQPGPIGVSMIANEDGYSNSCGSSYFVVIADLPGALSSDVTVNFDATGPGGESCPGQTITIPGGSTTANINVACGCAIANGGNLNMNITSITPTYIDGMYFDPYFQFNTSTGVDISADIQNCGCDSSIGDNCPQPTTTQLTNPNTYCFDTVRNYPSMPFYNYKIYAYSGSTVGGGGQTICTTDYEEAIDANNCSGCVTTTEAPAVCDIGDPLMAGVCYIPGGFGTTMIVTNGMIGVNTLNPGYPLDVDGTIRAAEVLTLSDARLKSSIEKIDNALEKIRAINGYAFTWKDSGKPDLGVLAQEIEKVFADAVSTDANGKKTVQYNALLAPVIEAIKELNTQIDSLYNEKFDNQVKRIEAIEKAVK